MLCTYQLYADYNSCSVVYLKHLWFWLLDWYPYILPAVSTLILVLLGVIMSLPTLADTVEKTSKYRKVLAIVCFAAGSIGFYSDVVQRHGSDKQGKELVEDTQTSLTDTKSVLTDTNNVVTRIGLMQLQFAELNTRLREIDLKVAEARGNPRLIADLQTQLRDTQAKADTLSKTSLLLMAPGIVAEMEHSWRNWSDEDEKLQDIGDIVVREWFHQHPQASQQELEQGGEQAREPNTKERTELSRVYTLQLLPLLTNANYLRQELLRGSEQTVEDKKNALIFMRALAGDSINWLEMKQITGYTANLVKRFAFAPSTSKSSN